MNGHQFRGMRGYAGGLRGLGVGVNEITLDAGAVDAVAVNLDGWVEEQVFTSCVREM